MSRKTKNMPVLWRIDRLRPHPKQAACFNDLSEEDLAELVRDIEANGQRTPAEVLPDGTILCGHQRVRALLLLGRKTVWVVVRADLAGDRRAAELLMIEDNLHRRQLSALDRVRCYVRIVELEQRKEFRRLEREEHGTFRD